MNVHQKPLPPMTVADFLEWPGDGAGTRYELVEGDLRAMAPGSDAHNTIVLNLSGLLWTFLRTHRPGYRAVAALPVQPRLRADWNYRIPDLGVTKSPNHQGDIMTPDPILLIEVLSPGNARDTMENIWAYATLPSVEEIVIVQSTKISAEVYRRSDNLDWPSEPLVVESGATTLCLKSIGADLLLADIYAGTHLV
jgi:Uma2 family endonuclease